MAKLIDLLFLLLTLKSEFSSCVEILNLNGDNWRLNDETGNFRNLSATVPGGVYSDLMRNKIIGDVFYGSNDTSTRWVAKTDWIYSLEFDVKTSILSYSNIKLTFDGLDTHSTIFLNHLEIGQSQNMFVRYSYNVSNILKSGRNLLQVRFVSPLKIAENLTHNEDYKIPPECPPDEYNGECYANQIRKMQSSFSWDWGPAFPSMGIWKNVQLEAYNSTIIRYVLVKTVENTDTWRIIVRTFLDSNRYGWIVGKLLYRFQTDVSVIEEIQNIVGNETEIVYHISVAKSWFRRWWPNGYGDQPLYNITVTFSTPSETNSKTVRIGFRKIELIQDEIDSGLTFYFKVNDIAIFAKGANAIPVNILPELGQNPVSVRKLLESVKLTNMNMLRVWGGGVYESDHFYDLADEFGILIWQDFMFACAMYPTYPNYLNNVIGEVQHQFKRLASHPSIVLWAGNNENEAALVQSWYGPSSKLYRDDYVRLYIDTIRWELRSIDNDTIFLTSSPTDGNESDRQGYLADDPQSNFYGDVHFYNYVFDGLAVSTYPIPRFASEYGYQSLPVLDSWLTTTDDITNLDMTSDFMNHRQHHPDGNTQNDLLISYQLSIPKNISRYIYYSQIVQALSIKVETEYYRSFQGRYVDDGRGNTMGALFWQLNDVWVAPTWSGIDFLGRWKMLHYYAKDFFAPTLITGYLNAARQLEVYVISDVISLIESGIDTQALITVYNWNSTQSVYRQEINLTLEYGKSVQVAKLNTDDLLMSLNCGTLENARQNCFFQLILKQSDLVLSPSNIVLVDALKNSNLQQVSVTITTISQLDENGRKFEINLESTGIALYVWLETHEIFGRFSENGFIQIETVKTVQFISEQIITVDKLRAVLTVTYLNDASYQQ